MEIVKLLREFTMKEKRIPVEGGKARFDGLEFDLKTELPLKGAGSKYYKLEVRTYVTPLHARVLARAEAAGVSVLFVWVSQLTRSQWTCSQDIWYLLQQRTLQWLQYMKECQKHDFAFVAFLDHRVRQHDTRIAAVAGTNSRAEYSELPRGCDRRMRAARSELQAARGRRGG